MTINLELKDRKTKAKVVIFYIVDDLVHLTLRSKPLQKLENVAAQQTLAIWTTLMIKRALEPI